LQKKIVTGIPKLGADFGDKKKYESVEEGLKRSV
jgi:hypothetical protein